MISCDQFRARFAPAIEDPALLDHVRACDPCLTAAASADPDIVFRSLGGDELMPPGGVDAFVSDVMREVRLRSTETSFVAGPVSWTRRLAIAATILVAIAGGAALYQFDRNAAPSPVAIARASAPPANVATRAVVQSYDSENATIVEMPTDGTDDVQVVMVFDESLPADL